MGQTPPQPPYGTPPMPTPGYGYAPPPKVGQGPDAVRPLNVGDVLDGMFRVLVTNWRTYLLAVGVIVAPTTLLVVWLQQRAMGGVGLIQAFTNPAAFEAATARSQGVTANLAQVANAANSLLVTPLVTGVAVAIASAAFLSHRIAAGEALRTGLRRYPAMLGTTVLYFLIMAAVFAPGVALALYGAVTSTPALIVVGVVLVLAAVVPAFWLAFSFVLANVAVVTERLGPVPALRRSRRLVRTRFWPVVGYSVLAGIVGAVVGGIAGFPLQLPGQLVGGSVGYVLLSAGTILTGILTAPLVANAQTLIYYDVRIRAEGLDLQLAADALGDGPLPAPQPGPAGWGGPG